MRRRAFLAILGCTAMTPSSPAGAQPGMPVIGFLGSTSPEQAAPAAFVDGLKDGGHVVGRSVAVEYRWAQGRPELLPAYAVELVALRVAIIVAPNPSAALAARDATQSIPIVFMAGRSVELGLAASFNRPGGNATGVDLFLPDLIPKRLELLRDLIPNGSAVAYFTNPESPSAAYQREMVEAAARATGFEMQFVESRTGSEIEQAFGRIATRRPDAILVGIDPLFFAERHRFIALAAQHRMRRSMSGRSTLPPAA